MNQHTKIYTRWHCTALVNCRGLSEEHSIYFIWKMLDNSLVTCHYSWNPFYFPIDSRNNVHFIKRCNGTDKQSNAFWNDTTFTRENDGINV